jgi:peptide/nickel transport system ATP-binding protein
MTSSAVLEVEGLDVAYAGPDGLVPTVIGFDLTMQPGEFVGLAGESGSGKSTAAQAILRLLRPPGVITGGSVRMSGRELLSMDIRQLRTVRWTYAAIVLQNSLTSLNPVRRIGRQIEEVLHRLAPQDRSRNVAELLTMVGLDAAVARAYPHELSGGMRQRVVIAMSLALDPSLLIMDEPTTALDVIVQRDIVESVRELQGRLGFAVLFITHDLPLLLRYSDRIAVMKSGEVVEVGAAERMRHDPQHPYTQRLLSAVPKLDGRLSDHKEAAR